MMKNTVIRIAVAGALLVGGYATAQAQALPSSDSSDLYLFVSDQAAGTTFAEDTGVSINSLLPTSDYTTGASLQTVTDSAPINLGASSALTAYINAANTAGQTLEWGVEGDQFASEADNTTKAPGGQVAVTDNNLVSSKISALILSNLSTWSNGFEGDTTYLGALPTGGAVFSFSDGTAGGNVWGASLGNNGGSTNEYGQGPDQSGVGLNQSAAFYAVTGNNSTGKVQSYVLGNIELTSNGTLETVSSVPAVPLPPAVWLLGSGLLGLAGIGRRRAA